MSLRPVRWTHTILPVAIAMTGLGLCPEWPIFNSSRTAHILTVAVGALAVFIPVRMVPREIVLNGSAGKSETEDWSRARIWVPLVGGAAIFLAGFWTHLAMLLAQTAQLLIAYAVVGPHLGFAGSEKNLP